MALGERMLTARYCHLIVLTSTISQDIKVIAWNEWPTMVGWLDSRNVTFLIGSCLLRLLDASATWGWRSPFFRRPIDLWSYQDIHIRSISHLATSTFDDLRGHRPQKTIENGDMSRALYEGCLGGVLLPRDYNVHQYQP